MALNCALSVNCVPSPPQESLGEDPQMLAVLYLTLNTMKQKNKEEELGDPHL